jgi:OMF family outer membrane factor
MGDKNFENMRRFLYVLLLFFGTTAFGQSPQRFSTWKALEEWVIKNATVMQLNQEQLRLAELTEQASWVNTINPRIPTTASWLNNTDLPVNFIPGQVFGGPEGTFREVTFGQQYISSFTAAPQFDIVNVAKWQDIRAAKANTKVVANEGAVNRIKMLEQVNVLYCGIIQLKKQQKMLERFVGLSDSLSQIVGRKYEAGLVRLQDRNDAQVNVIQQKGLLRNIEHQLNYQQSLLSALAGVTVEIEPTEGLEELEVVKPAQNLTALNLATYKVDYAKMMYRSSQLEQLPVLSFQSSLAYQNNSNAQWMDPASKWIYSSFVGAKLTWDLPTNAVKATNVRAKKINFKMAEILLEEEKRNTKVRNEQLMKDWENAKREVEEKELMAQLEKDSYRQAGDQYEKEIIGLDKFILAQNKWLSAQLSVLNARINQQMYQQKIRINYAN